MRPVVVSRLKKRYGDTLAVNDVSFEVESSEIFGVLGPNGAGKTTTLEIIEGLRKPDEGQVFVLGMDVLRDASSIKERTGVQLQGASPIIGLRVHETVKLFASIFSRKANIGQLLSDFGLEEIQRTPVRYLSGGQQQRLSVALALVNDPEIVFLDEPTTGFDPQGRRALWDLIRDLRANGKTVVFTSHYMEEAEALCDRVAIMDQGEIIALDAPQKLVRALEFENTVECSLEGEFDSGELSRLPAVRSVRSAEGSFLLNTSDVTATIGGLVRLSEETSTALSNISVRTAALEDVFIELTGKRLAQ